MAIKMRQSLPSPAYLERYGLADRPFSTTASPRYAYARKSHIEAVNQLRNVVVGKSALGVCSGSVGLGKTTIARMLAEDLRVNEIPTIFLPDVPGGIRQSDASILRTVLTEFKLQNSRSNSSAGNYATIGKFARENDDDGTTTVVIIDEAHRLKTPGIRAVLQLLALQTTESQLMQIILFGQNPELMDAVTGNPAMHTRLSAHVELTPFAEEEVAQMIAHRLKVAQRTEPLFTKKAIHELTIASNGIPRTICRIANGALIRAAQRNSDLIDAPDIIAVSSELKHTAE